MDYNILVIVGIFGFSGVVIFAMVLKDWRHAFNVPEGQVRLLYHKGKFVEVLGASGQPEVDTLSIIREFNLPGPFEEDALEDARQQAEVLWKLGQCTSGTWFRMR